MTRKWLITMVIVSPLVGLWDPLQMAVSWLVNGGDPNHLLSGVILQVLVPSMQTNIAGWKNPPNFDGICQRRWGFSTAIC